METLVARGVRVFLNPDVERVVVWDPEKQILGLASPGIGCLDVSGEVDQQDVERFMKGVPEELACAVLQFIKGQ